MIVRIVKITLQPGKRPDFIALFETVLPSILSFEGCSHVELLKDIHNDDIVFTLSHWHTEANLKNYRESVLFAGTWSKARLLFAQKAEAWSLESSSGSDS